MIKACTILLLFSLLFSKTEALSQPGIMLSVDGNKTDSIQRGEALLIKVIMTNPSARSAASWNAAAKKHLSELDERLKLKQISRQDFDKEKKSIESQLKKSTTITIGSEKEPWTQLVKWNIVKKGERSSVSWPLKLMSNPGTAAVATLDERAYYFCLFGIDPSIVSQLPSGLYEVTAMIDNIRSNVITVSIDATSLPVQIQNDVSHLLKLGKFYWHSGDAVKAIEYAEKVLSSVPASIGALLLKADAFRLQKSWSAALELYNKALNEYYNKAGKDAEPPDYIIDMIEIVKGKIN